MPEAGIFARQGAAIEAGPALGLVAAVDVQISKITNSAPHRHHPLSIH
jgi:hypothetical protein